MVKCKVCNEREATTGEGMCKKCWRRDYDKKNKDRIRIRSRQWYTRNLEKCRKVRKDWLKKQGENYQSDRMKKRYVDEREMNLIRQRTKKTFSHLKVACIKCKRMDVPLEFHHLEPYSYDHFKILCPECHREEHSGSLTEMEEDMVALSTLPAPPKEKSELKGKDDN